jgi:hypothetical protein
MYAQVRHILPMTLIRRERLLPATGKVVVRAGQKVAPLDTVAEANLYPEYVLLDVARGLGVPGDKADKLLQCQVGDTIAQGDIIAGPVGVARRLIRSPKDGKVVLTGGGQVLIETAGKPFQLRAALPGDVTDLVADFGAVIETGGALVQGVWGNGGLEFGPLRVQVKSPDEDAHTSEMDVSLRGSILLAGCCRNEDVLKAAGELPLRGLIFSSMDARLIPAASRLAIPVIVLEGFGKRPYNPVVYRLLTTNEQRSTAVNAEAWNPYTGACPEVIIPTPTPSTVVQPPEIVPLVPGATVRLLRQPGMGEIGHVVGLHQNTVLTSGLRARAADVQLEDGQTLLVPTVNLEIIT